uniref:Uncharacterized protein n=1 Tax=Cacopsylla melanoneura TaxID=428564 RepID=A0A8D9BAQ8_9HEMI
MIKSQFREKGAKFPHERSFELWKDVCVVAFEMEICIFGQKKIRNLILTMHIIVIGHVYFDGCTSSHLFYTLDPFSLERWPTSILEQGEGEDIDSYTLFTINHYL